MPSVAQSPALVLLTGQNFVRRASNDAIYQINGFTKLSVAVTFDPRVVYTAGQDGTLISKHRADNDQRQWRVVYTAATGLITVELYDGVGAGAALCSRVTSVGVTTRAVFTFVYDGASPSLDLYINGTLSNGTLTGTVPATLVVNTEPVAIGAEATSGTPTSVWRGAVYMVAIWNLALSGAEVGTILRDGLVPSALEAGPKAPQIICEHTAIVQTTTYLISQWTDSAGNNRHLTGGATAGSIPFAQQAVAGFLLSSNRWDDSLTDVGIVGLGQGLSSTYTSAPPFRLWGAPLAPPTRATWRNGKHDFTVLLRARRIAGTSETLFFQAYGVELRYQLSSQEMYAIVGVDTSVTNQNKKISFGISLFPVEGLTVDVALRYNSESDDVDLFIGSTQYAKTQTASNSYYDGTTLTLSDEADFSQSIVVPMCLSDAQISQLQTSIQQDVYSFLPNSFPLFGQLAAPQYTPAVSAAGAVVDDGIGDASIAVDISNVRSFAVRALPQPGGTLDPYSISEVPDNLFDDPNPQVVSVTVDSSHNISAIAEAGFTDAYLTVHWWEIEIDPVLGQVAAVTDPITGTFFFASRAQNAYNFKVPLGQSWTGKRIRFVVQALSDAAQIWYSPWFLMEGADFENAPAATILAGVPPPLMRQPTNPNRNTTLGTMPGVGVVVRRERDFS